MDVIKKIILLLLLLILSAKSYSGTIKGNISDQQSDDPIVGAVVMLVSTAYGTTTGLDGSYVLHSIPKGEYELEISYPSFEIYKRHISINNDTQVIVVNGPLSQLSKTLSEVQVKAKYNNGSDEQARNMEKTSN